MTSADAAGTHQHLRRNALSFQSLSRGSKVVELTHNPINVATATEQVVSHQAGAVVTFLGTTREFTAGRQTLTLRYECYEVMARSELERLEQEARERWSDLQGCLIIHRLGNVGLGEASVLVSVSTPHRGSAFEAAEWIMDELKKTVPIWKQEHWADGSQEWVHPGAADPSVRDTSGQQSEVDHR